MPMLRIFSEGGEGPNTELAWLLLSGLAIFLLVIAAGWWSSSKKQASVEAGHTAEDSRNAEVDDLAKTLDVNPKAVKATKKARRKAK